MKEFCQWIFLTLYRQIRKISQLTKEIYRPCVAYLLKCLQNGVGHKFRSQRWYTKSPVTGWFKFSISLMVLFLFITMQSKKLLLRATIFKGKMYVIIQFSFLIHKWRDTIRQIYKKTDRSPVEISSHGSLGVAV